MMTHINRYLLSDRRVPNGVRFAEDTADESGLQDPDKTLFKFLRSHVGILNRESFRRPEHRQPFLRKEQDSRMANWQGCPSENATS